MLDLDNVLAIFTLYCVAKTAACSNSSDAEIWQIPANGTFFYFAYGSNLLKNRITINNPSASFVTKAKLLDWRLDFNLTSDTWNGAVATIVKHPGVTVWGDVWTLSVEDLPNLDRQEGVHLGWYYPVNVTVHSEDLGPVWARAYVEYDPPAYVDPDLLPPERQPSRTYFQVILYGAIESRLPVSYLDYLERFPNNGKKATEVQLHKLGYPFWDASASRGLNPCVIIE